MNLEVLTKKVAELTLDVGKYIREQSSTLDHSVIEEKGLHDLVTYVDKTSEKQLVEALNKLIPEAGFIVEENQEINQKKEVNWIIDPLDGTTNFIHGVPPYSISVALEVRNRIEIGVVYEITRNECFEAWRGGGAYLNGKPTYVSKTNKLEKALLATGFPYSDYSLLQSYLSFFEEMIRETRGIRRPGSAAVDLAYTACGRFDAFFEYALNTWDVAAGTLLIIEAGGMVSDFKGTADYLSGKRIMASNGLLHQTMIDRLGKHFK